MQSLGTKIQSALSPQKALLGLGAGLAGVFAASKLIGFFGDAIDAASNLNETISKTGVILGKEALPGLEKWAEGAALAFGQSKQQALDAASTFAIFGKSAGLAGNDLSGFSTDLTELASDLSSFYNTSPEDAIVAIGAALRGESEPIRRYGVLLDEATLRQRALKDGIIQTTAQALTPQQRVLAAQAEIFAQTADAQGDFARTSDGLANSQRQIAAAFEDVKVEIGNALLPVLLNLAIWFKEDGIQMVKGLISALGDLGDAIGDVIGLMGDIGQAWATVGINFGDMGDRVHSIADAAGVDFDTVKQRIVNNMRIAGMSFEDAADNAETAFNRLSSDYDATVTEVEDRPLARLRTIDEMKTVVAEGTDAIVEDVKKLPGEMADAMLANQFELTDATADLVRFIEEGLTPAQEKAQAIAFLTSQEYADALASGKPAAIAKANELAAAALKVLATPDTSTVTTGAGNIATAFVDALVNGLDRQVYRINVPLSRYAGKMIGSSPPKEGPLKDIDKGGFNIGKAWLDGLNLAIGGKLALPGMPGLGSGSLGPMAGGASTINNTWNLTVSGAQYPFKTRDDFIKALDDVSRFGGEGRLPNG